MQGKRVSVRTIVAAVAFLAALVVVPSEAQLKPDKPGKFKCANKGETPFCLKNTTDKPVYVSGISVYSGPGKTGRRHSPIQDGNPGDDIKLDKGGRTCKCVSFVPKSYSVSVFSQDVELSPLGAYTFLTIMCAVLNELPLFEEGGVSVTLGEHFQYEPTPDAGSQFYVENGTSGYFEDAFFETLEGKPYDGWLTLMPSLPDAVDPDAVAVERER